MARKKGREGDGGGRGRGDFLEMPQLETILPTPQLSSRATESKTKQEKNFLYTLASWAWVISVRRRHFSRFCTSREFCFSFLAFPDEPSLFVCGLFLLLLQASFRLWVRSEAWQTNV